MVTPNCQNKIFNAHFRPNVEKILRRQKMQIEIAQPIKVN